MRKRRSDSKLYSLPDKVQREIYALAESMTLAEACEKLALPVEMGGYEVDVSESTLSNFCKHWRAVEFRESLHEGAAVAQEVDGALSQIQREQIDQATEDGLRNWVLDSIVNKTISAKEVKSIMGVLVAAKKTELDERKIALLEKKAAQADEAGGVLGDAKLTPEEKQKRLEGIFGFGG